MTTGSAEHRVLPRLLAAAACGALCLSLAACAPEPEQVPDDVASDAQADSDGSKGQEDSDSWSEDTPDEAYDKHAKLPDSLTQEAFTVPKGAKIDDAGERDSGSWFVVLRAADAASADALWESVIEENGFEVGDQSETPDGITATLSKSGTTVVAMRIADADGAELLSYDIAAE